MRLKKATPTRVEVQCALHSQATIQMTLLIGEQVPRCGLRHDGLTTLGP